MPVIIDTLLAVICFASTPSEPMTCHNALIGSETPKGEYTLRLRRFEDPLYGNSMLQFKETKTDVFGIHWTWLGKPSEQRQKRIKSTNVTDRFITQGCVNVEPLVYKKLVACCSNSKVLIR